MNTQNMNEALNIRDAVARRINKVGKSGYESVSIDHARKVAEVLIREGWIDVELVEDTLIPNETPEAVLA